MIGICFDRTGQGGDFRQGDRRTADIRRRITVEIRLVAETGGKTAGAVSPDGSAGCKFIQFESAAGAAVHEDAVGEQAAEFLDGNSTGHTADHSRQVSIIAVGEDAVAIGMPAVGAQVH